MYLCFMDESGSPPKPTAKSPRPYFVIAAVIMHEAQWHGVSDDLKKLRWKPDFRVLQEIKWRFFGADNNDPDNSVKHLNRVQRDEFRRQFFEILVRRKSVRTMACIASVSAAYASGYVHDAEDLYAYTYKVISERFQYYLQDISRTVGEKQFGIVIADHRGKKQDESLRLSHHRLVEMTSDFTSKYDNYIETVFMTPSHLSIGIQFADMVAGAIGRSYNGRDTTWLDVIRPTLRTSPGGKVDGYGLIKFPKIGWV